MKKNNEKIKTGVALEKYVIDELDNIVNNNVDLGVTRSEIINAMLKAIIKQDTSKNKKNEKIRSWVIQIRKGMFCISFF